MHPQKYQRGSSDVRSGGRAHRLKIGDNLEKRLKQHNAGRTPSTKPYRPWTVVYSETFPDKTSAYLREMKIKSMKSRSIIESLINHKG